MSKTHISRKGGASCHTIGCNPKKAMMHNERLLEEYDNKNIDPSLSGKNVTIKSAKFKKDHIWYYTTKSDEELKEIAEEVRDPVEYEKRARKDYYDFERERTYTSKKKDGEKVKTTKKGHFNMPAHYCPTKEMEINLPTGEPEEVKRMLKGVTNKVRTLTGWIPLRIYGHLDERRYLGKDKDGNKLYKPNFHGHIIWGCYDFKSHQMITVKRPEMRKMQDIASEVTGMPRGYDARITGKDGMTTAQYKMMKAIETMQEFDKWNREQEEYRQSTKDRATAYTPELLTSLLDEISDRYTGEELTRLLTKLGCNDRQANALIGHRKQEQRLKEQRETLEKAVGKPQNEEEKAKTVVVPKREKGITM